MTHACSPARSRNSAATRAAILAAARKLFARDSYDQVGLRDVGAAACVDPALIVRYFGGKEGLFEQVLAASDDPKELFEGDRADIGWRVAQAVTLDEKSPEGVETLMICLHSASSPKASALLRESIEARFVGPLTAFLGGEAHRTQARLIFAYVMGVAVTRAMICPGSPPSPEQAQAFASRFAQDIQALVERPTDG